MKDIQRTNDKDSAFGALKMDPARYREYLEDFDLTEAQQNELLETLWHILSTMVDIGFGLDSVQMLLPVMIENAGMETQDSVKEMGSAASFNQLATERPEHNQESGKEDTE